MNIQTVAPPRRAVSGARQQPQHQRNRTAYLFLLPYLIVFVIFLLLPAIAGFFIGFTDWRILGDPHWVGFKNFQTMFADKFFWQAFRNTLAFSGLAVPALVAGGLGLAVLLNMKLPGRLISRTIAFIPYAIMVTVVGILWRWIYDQNFGLLNFYLGTVFPQMKQISWLTSPQRALPAIALTTVWWQVGTNMIIYLAGLQEIPEELYDAAKVDGANPLQQFRYITLPGLYLTHVFVIPMSVISSLRVFGQVMVMTGGGPIGSTYTVVQHLYSKGWINQFMGEAAAVGVFLFLVTFVLTILQLRYFRATT
ncbi:MAG: sugar ABC transporter permease [Anaerolineae bacterium]|nr:sugar ABC transporter permease [Anaerolineae bacterium]